jgi:DNA polymerase-1
MAAPVSAYHFRHVWCIDFEFVAPLGHKPRVVCMVAKCLVTGKFLSLWESDLTACPFSCDDKEVFVAYYASAETSCFDALGWPRPQRVIDLFAEFRCLTNGVGPLFGNGLLGALQHFGLPSIGGEDKAHMRELIMSGGPWSKAERSEILSYCESDVDALMRLFPRLWPHFTQDDVQLGQALLRGRYMAAVGVVENNGVPIDTPLLARLSKHWHRIKEKLVAEVDADYGVYQGTAFSSRLFEQYLIRHGIPWPRLEGGGLMLDDDTFRDQSKAHPQLRNLHELRTALSRLRLSDLSVGNDGRCRTLLSAFRAKTGRNQPSTSRFIFGPSRWIRQLIRPRPGMALAYVDWSSQELAVAGALSGDPLLWDAYEGGDPYIAFAIQAGIAPKGATKASNPTERDQCKSIVLGVNYGMSAAGIAAKSGIHVVRARGLLDLHRATYHVFWSWAEANVNHVLLGEPLETVFGWRIHFPPNCGAIINDRSILNWPMQAHGAEMMRLAVAQAVEEGLKICAPVHDALLLEGPADAIEAHAARLAQIMGDASEIVLGKGKRCRTDTKIVKAPDRYVDDKDDGTFFSQIMKLLAEAEANEK